MSVFPETGKCYELTHKKTGWGSEEVRPPKYLGKYIGDIVEGPPYDRYMILNFQYDNNVDPGGKFKLTTCREEQVFKAGKHSHTKKSKRSKSRSKKARKTLRRV